MAFRVLQSLRYGAGSVRGFQSYRSRISPQARCFSRSIPFTQRGFNYQRFNATKGFLQQWSQSPNFYYQVTAISGGVGGIYIYNLETVPVSGRRRFNIVSDDLVRKTSGDFYQSILQEEGDRILPESHPVHRRVERILERLIPHSGLPNEEWKVHVINKNEQNAFVIPGGKVFVYSGLLPITQDDDGLACVLGHEIAHNVANHAGEKMSQSSILMGLGMLVSIALGIGDFGLAQTAVDLAFLRPGSRKQESEADYIGLMMMSEACFDPSASIGLWDRMGKAAQGDPPQFLSTHPAGPTRMKAFQEWLPKAEMEREKSGCGMTGSYAKDFGQAFERWSS